MNNLLVLCYSFIRKKKRCSWNQQTTKTTRKGEYIIFHQSMLYVLLGPSGFFIIPIALVVLRKQFKKLHFAYVNFRGRLQKQIFNFRAWRKNVCYFFIFNDSLNDFRRRRAIFFFPWIKLRSFSLWCKIFKK